MTRHSARYMNTEESASIPETINWLQQSNFLNCSQSEEYEINHGEIMESEYQQSQVAAMTQSHSLPSTIILPYPEQTSSLEHGIGEKLMDEEEARRILLAITVEVEDGHLEYIEIRDGDSAEAAATKFCQTHLLPEKYVAPLTEHIVEEVRRISKVDKTIRFASQDGTVYTDEAASSQDLQITDKNCGSQVDAECSSSGKSRRRERNKHNNNNNKGNHHPKVTKSLSESLLSPTFTSLAKSQNNHQIEKIKEPRKPKHLSERAKAVYMRLYGEFLRHKQRIEEEKRWCQEQYKQRIEREKPSFSKKTRRIMRLRGRAAKQFRNYGELLYREGLNREEEKQRLIQRKLQEDEDKELRTLTFKPEISKLAKQIKRDDGPVWDRLLNEKPRRDLKELRQEVWEAKFMECTFRPRVNQWHSEEEEEEEEEDLRHSRFDQLFWDAENRRRRQAEYGQWYPEGATFRPLINRYSKSGMIDDHGKYQQGNVFERLMQYAEKLSEKKKKLQWYQDGGHKPIDSSTGRELFRPQIGRKPLSERNASSLPIGEFLYLQKFELENKKETLAAKERQERKELAKGHYVGPRSQKLLIRARQRKYHKLFEYLDKDKDGFVDIDPSELKQLPEEIIANALEVKHLENLNRKHLSFSEFLDLLSHVKKKTKITRVPDIHCTKRKHHNNENFTFQFKMDQNSRNLANRKRRFSTRHQWYKMILTDRAKWQAKVENLRKEKQKQELAECTFRPAIHSTNSRNHLALSDVTLNNVSSKAEPQKANIVEKELREVHGFIFQEAAVPKTDSAQDLNSKPSLGLLESFKNIVKGNSEPSSDNSKPDNQSLNTSDAM